MAASPSSTSGRTPPEGPPAHFRFTPQQIQDEMQQAGYELQSTHDYLPRQHFLIFR